MLNFIQLKSHANNYRKWGTLQARTTPIPISSFIFFIPLSFTNMSGTLYSKLDLSGLKYDQSVSYLIPNPIRR